MMLRSTLALCLTAGSGVATAAFELEELTRLLNVASPGGEAWASLSMTGDVAGYQVDRPAPGLLVSDSDRFVAPRASATLDAGYGRLLGHIRVTADRGFDPLFEEDGDVRVDEAFVEVELHGPTRANARLGKFSTAFGGWVGRHLPWDNPLINAPLPYDDMLTITDAAVPDSAAVLLARRDQPENKHGWVPAVWGPSYATGAALSAGAGSLAATIEIKNASLSSRPGSWSPWQRGFDAGATISGRARWQPAPEWDFGVSFSRGAYLRERAAETLTDEVDIDDPVQEAVGFDIGYQHRRTQLWGELIHSRFDLPGLSSVAVTSGFVEFRYKLATRLWLAGRWNQSWFDELADEPWDRDVRAADVGIGYRWTSHVQGKVQYRWIDQEGDDTHGGHVLAVQAVAWF